VTENRDARVPFAHATMIPAPMPVYWKPRYATRSARHRAWVKQQAKREEALRRRPAEPVLTRLLQRFRRR